MEDLHLLIAKNLKFFMNLPAKGSNAKEPRFRSANALAVKAGLSPGTVRNYLDPSKRTTTSEKPEGHPVLDKLAKLAAALDCGVWELLHPDIEKYRRELEMYHGIQESLKRFSEAQVSDDEEAERLTGATKGAHGKAAKHQ